MHSVYLLRQRGWVAGWVSSHAGIVPAKPILKHFQPSGSPIILVFPDPCADTNSKGNPFSGGVKYTGWEKLAIYVQFSK